MSARETTRSTQEAEPEEAVVGAQAPRGVTRRRILTTLRKSDGLSADQLAVLLGITSMAVRKHLAALEHDGLVATTVARGGIGRPAHIYRLSSLADDFFPKRYDLLATDLLSDLLRIDGEQKVELLLARRAERTRQSLAQRLEGVDTLVERVATLAEELDQLGYLASSEQLDDGTCVLRQYNCVIHRVASCFPGACHFEQQMYRDLLGADVERSSHIATGGSMCCYVIRPHAAHAPHADAAGAQV
ncbi:MAG TPA: metalloregulator ArsR/SmtB family transcription factor [Thermomicrobiaceae bacterium]|nr:metalloregulator ArsR/SmtB family transcription factor [Thermomicrobiaceae bacterium]